jgi:hypothetical protein
MRTHFLIAGAAVAALVAGGASATVHRSHHKSHLMAANMYAAPSQPIPYAKLDSYLAAKPSERASMGDNGAPMGSGPMPQASDTGMSPPAAPNPEPTPGAGDQMGNSGSMNGVAGSSGAPPAAGDNAGPPATGETASPSSPAATPDTTQNPPDGSSTPPK